jgi:hypothetical protein
VGRHQNARIHLDGGAAGNESSWPVGAGYSVVTRPNVGVAQDARFEYKKRRSLRMALSDIKDS